MTVTELLGLATVFSVVAFGGMATANVLRHRARKSRALARYARLDAEIVRLLHEIEDRIEKIYELRNQP